MTDSTPPPDGGHRGVVFHDLSVALIEQLTDDSVAITFEVPEELRTEFSYSPGQHVTVRADVGGDDVRRSYSICANAQTGVLRIGVKRLEGGAFSTFATRTLQPGDRLGVMTPIGDFTLACDPMAANRYAAIVAGSGITPVLSMVSTSLAVEPQSRWTVVYGNRNAASVMFLDELEGLKDRYPSRLQLIHVLSREDTGLPLTSGRIDGQKLADLFATLVPPSTVDRWFLCGPYEMVTQAHAALESAGVMPDRVSDELFFAGPAPAAPPPPPKDEPGTVELTVTLDGRSTTTRMRPDTSVLDAAMAVRPDLPFSCKGGMCATCKAKVTDGGVTMVKNHALIDSDLESGFVLTCQSHPVGDRLAVDFDQR